MECHPNNGSSSSLLGVYSEFEKDALLRCASSGIVVVGHVVVVADYCYHYARIKLFSDGERSESARVVVGNMRT
jgi:hypothetical protein